MARFTILPMGVAPPLRDPILSALAEIDRELIEAGGKRYLSGWLFEPNDERWRRHFGEGYGAWTQGKVRYDPHGVLRSQLFSDQTRTP